MKLIFKVLSFMFVSLDLEELCRYFVEYIDDFFFIGHKLKPFLLFQGHLEDGLLCVLNGFGAVDEAFVELGDCDIEYFFDCF